MSLTETSKFIGLCGNVISIPTGFVEAACALNETDYVKVIFIHPCNKDIFSYFVNSNTLNMQYSTEVVGYYGSEFATEMAKAYFFMAENFVADNINLSVFTFEDNKQQDDNMIVEIVAELEN